MKWRFGLPIEDGRRTHRRGLQESDVAFANRQIALEKRRGKI